MRRRFKALLVTSTLAFGPVPSGRAFDRADSPLSCAGLLMSTTLRWRFENDTATWTNDEKQIFRQNIAHWQSLLDASGIPVLNAVESPTGEVRVVRRMEHSGDSGVSCSAGVPTIYIYSPAATLASPGFLPTTSSHEAGHAFSLDHAGNDESLMYGASTTNRAPRMVACSGGGPSSGFPESDDWAQTMAKRNGPSLPVGYFNPDAGFETFRSGLNLSPSDPRRPTLLMWQGMKSLVASTSNSNDYAQLGQTGGLNTSLSQSTRMSNPPSSLLVRARYKSDSSGIGTNFKLRYRTISFPAGPPPSGNAWPSNFNVCAPSFGVWTTPLDVNVSGATSFVDSPSWFANLPAAQGVEVQILATNLNSNSGNSYVDDFQVRAN